MTPNEVKLLLMNNRDKIEKIVKNSVGGFSDLKRMQETLNKVRMSIGVSDEDFRSYTIARLEARV